MESSIDCPTVGDWAVVLVFDDYSPATLLNKLLGEHKFEVKGVREKDNKGKHTTVRRQLTCLQSGSIFIDTPGMRELGNFAIDNGLDETFGKMLKNYKKSIRKK
jgi:ribosome biogenesis GTPase